MNATCVAQIELLYAVPWIRAGGKARPDAHRVGQRRPDMGSLRRLPFYPPLDGDQGASLLLHHHQRRRRRGALRPLPLAIETDPDRYLAGRRDALECELWAVGKLSEAGNLQDVEVVDDDIKITPLRAVTPS